MGLFWAKTMEERLLPSGLFFVNFCWDYQLILPSCRVSVFAKAVGADESGKEYELKSVCAEYRLEKMKFFDAPSHSSDPGRAMTQEKKYIGE